MRLGGLVSTGDRTSVCRAKLYIIIRNLARPKMYGFMGTIFFDSRWGFSIRRCAQNRTSVAPWPYICDVFAYFKRSFATLSKKPPLHP